VAFRKRFEKEPLHRWLRVLSIRHAHLRAVIRVGNCVTHLPRRALHMVGKQVTHPTGFSELRAWHVGFAYGAGAKITKISVKSDTDEDPPSSRGDYGEAGGDIDPASPTRAAQGRPASQSRRLRRGFARLRPAGTSGFAESPTLRSCGGGAA
jgi:hypothetical protein